MSLLLVILKRFLQSEQINSNLSTPVCGSVSSTNLNYPDFPDLPHLLSDTAPCITSEVEITNDDGLIHRDLLVRSSSWWLLPLKKLSTLRVCLVFTVVFTMLYLMNCFMCTVVFTVPCILCVLFVVFCEIDTEIMQFFRKDFTHLVHHSSVDLFG